MDVSLPGEEATAAALQQPEHADDNQQPEIDAPQQSGEQTDVYVAGGSSRTTHRASMSTLVVAELAWVALLAYIVYSIWP